MLSHVDGIQVRKSREFGRTMSAVNLPEAVREFFAFCSTRTEIVDELMLIREAIGNCSLVGSSLLVAFDVNGSWKVKLIDFAHSFANSEQHLGVYLGIDNLISMIKY